MTAVTSIVLADAQATPVNHTFIPLGPDAKGVWWFEDQSASSPIGYNRIGLKLTRPVAPTNGQSSKDRVNRVQITLATPALETLGNDSTGLTPPPTVAFIDRASAEFVLPERDSKDKRKDLRAYLSGLIDDPQVVGMIEDLQNVY